MTRASLLGLDAFERIERKVDRLVEMATGKGAASAAPTSTPPSDPLNPLKRRIAKDEVRLPGIVTHSWDRDGEIIAVSLRYGGLDWTIEELIKLGVMDPDGRVFRHHIAGGIAHSIEVAKGNADPGAHPGRPRL